MKLKKTHIFFQIKKFGTKNSFEIRIQHKKVMKKVVRTNSVAIFSNG